MREIKFRAWDKTNEKWLHRPTFYIHCDGKINTWEVGEEDKYLSEYHDDLVLMQFTGLLDKKGVEIWESDVVKWRVGEYGGKFQPLVIEYYKGGFKLKDTWCNFPANIHELSGIEVIGNIYQHPHLLETNNET